MSQESTWKSQAGFVWSLIGSAVGFANILSFSAKAYKNGGGAYLIPYIFALLLVGIPFLILEGKIGHQWKAPLVTAYGRVWNQWGKIFGWLAVLACLTIGAFYVVLTGYSVAYTFFSATNQIPEDTQTFFLHRFLNVSSNVFEIGSFSIPIFLSTALVGLTSWYILRKQVRDGIEKICSLFMPILAILMLLFAIAVFFLPGGAQGWVYYLKPDFSKILDFGLWCDVFGQLFFSLSLGLGIVVGYSRHTGKTAQIGRAMMYVALGDFAVSFIAGSAIFGCLAHISHVQGIPFDQILTSDSTFEIGFILFPKIMKVFGPLAPLTGTLFFFSVFIAGITGVFSIVESISGNIEFEFKKTRSQAVALSLGVMMSLSLFFCMGNSSHLIDALAPMVIGINMLIGGLALLFAFAYRQGTLPKLPQVCLRFFAPAILGVILIGNLYQETNQINQMTLVRWSWLALALLLSSYLSQLDLKKREIAS